MMQQTQALSHEKEAGHYYCVRVRVRVRMRVSVRVRVCVCCGNGMILLNYYVSYNIIFY